MVRGLDTFAAFFAGDEQRYALIGGVATQLVLEDAGLTARATKDLDIVLRVEVLDAGFGRKLWDFIEAGGYDIRQRSQGTACYYRFARPNDPAFPVMLEFFAREPGHMPLIEGAHLTPVPLTERRAVNAAAVDSKHLGKHRNDVLRLSQLLSPADRVELAGAMRADIERFCRDVFPEISVELLRHLEIDEVPDALIDRLRRYFGADVHAG